MKAGWILGQDVQQTGWKRAEEWPFVEASTLLDLFVEKGNFIELDLFTQTPRELLHVILGHLHLHLVNRKLLCVS